MDTVDSHMTYLGKNYQPITISHTPRATQSWYHGHVSHLFQLPRASFAWWEHRELGNEMWPQNLGELIPSCGSLIWTNINPIWLALWLKAFDCTNPKHGIRGDKKSTETCRVDEFHSQCTPAKTLGDRLVLEQLKNMHLMLSLAGLRSMCSRQVISTVVIYTPCFAEHIIAFACIRSIQRKTRNNPSWTVALKWIWKKVVISVIT